MQAYAVLSLLHSPSSTFLTFLERWAKKIWPEPVSQIRRQESKRWEAAGIAALCRRSGWEPPPSRVIPLRVRLQDSSRCLRVPAGWCSQSPPGVCNGTIWSDWETPASLCTWKLLTAHYFWKSHHLWLAVIYCAGVTNCPWPRWHSDQLRVLLKGGTGAERSSAPSDAQCGRVSPGTYRRTWGVTGRESWSQTSARWESAPFTHLHKVTSPENVHLLPRFLSAARGREGFGEDLGPLRACSYSRLSSAVRSRCSEDFAKVLPSQSDCSALFYNILVSNQQIFMRKKPENNSV